MPAPKRPNTTAATAKVIRRGQETAAAKLRAAGWVCIPPEQIDELPAATARHLNNLNSREETE
jgi:hypothetical protein